MNDLEGRIHVNLSLTEQGVTADIASRRPVLASRVFEGRSVAEALALVPLVYSLCGQAQSIASVRAIESALGTPASTAVENGREILVRLESLREHLWRIFIDWPELLGENRRMPLLVPVNQALVALQKHLNTDGALNRQPGESGWRLDAAHQQQWQALHQRISGLMFDPANEEGQVFPFLLLDQLVTLGWADLGSASLSPLKTPEICHLSSVLRGQQADQFVARPHWSGQVCESGPFARQRSHPALQRARQTFGDGIYTRFAARVVEVIQQMDELNRLCDGETLGQPMASRGIAQVEAVRGLLIHCVDIEDGKIQRYRIVAPTEWNFHPRGVAQRMLAGIQGQSEEQLQQQARLVIQAIDPCVGFDIHVKRQVA